MDSMKNFRKDIMGRLGNNLFQYAFLYTLTREGVIPNIYIQAEDWFGKYAAEIKEILKAGITEVDKVAIHVRRGDYVDNPFYVDLPTTDYYARAMGEFGNAKFLVFSDDIEHCKTLDIFKECEFSEGLSEEDDLNLMASCKGIIISNSSFSWWAATLGSAERVFAGSSE